MFGKNLRRLRTDRGLTQVKLAEMAKINRRYFQQVEGSQRNPTVLVAARLRKALKCDWNDLLKGL